MSNYYSITIKDNLQYIYLTMFIMIYNCRYINNRCDISKNY